jgi:outer membrane murein-binding lipoprotein Lpp
VAADDADEVHRLQKKVHRLEKKRKAARQELKAARTAYAPCLL